jgi:hypothetical protein
MLLNNAFAMMHTLITALLCALRVIKSVRRAEPPPQIALPVKVPISELFQAIPAPAPQATKKTLLKEQLALLSHALSRAKPALQAPPPPASAATKITLSLITKELAPTP